MARRTAGGPARPSIQPIRARSANVPEVPAAADFPPARPSRRLALLPPDWLPLSLILVDAVIVTATVLMAFWYRHNVDFINPRDRVALAFGPYVAALPAVVLIYLFALALNKQYRSWRGRTLVDQLLQLY